MEMNDISMWAAASCEGCSKFANSGLDLSDKWIEYTPAI